jgi:membrane fusion protein (multidrug efflux system)
MVRWSFLAALMMVLAPAASAQQAASPPSVPVEAAKVETGPMSERITAVGSLRSDESVIARSEVAGRVVEIGFEEGRPVEKGALLLKLDDSLNRAEVADAEARLELAKRNFSRTEELFGNQVATARSRDEARSSLDVGTATLELAKVRLEKTRLIAPFSGIVGLRLVSIGDYITVGQDLFNLEDIDPIKADFRVSERYLSAVRPGQAIEIGVDAYPGKVFKGEVFAIDPRIDAAGRSVVIRARIANQEKLLRPGLFARVTLILELKPDALTVPEQALMPRGDDQFVYKVIDGKVKHTKVTIGTRRDGRVEIVDGLGRDDVVVTAGQQKIRDGGAVRVLDEARSGESGTGKGA